VGVEGEGTLGYSSEGSGVGGGEWEGVGRGGNTRRYFIKSFRAD